MSPEPRPPILLLPDGVIDLHAAQLRRNGQIEPLLPIEVDLLRYLSERPGIFVPVEQLHVDVWGYSARARTRAAYFAIRRLRARMEPMPRKPVVLVGTEGRGFALHAPRLDEEQGVRGADRQRVLHLLQRPSALVVLTGPAGTGKSRLLHDLARYLDTTVVDLDEAQPDRAALQARPLLLLDHLPKATLRQQILALRRRRPDQRIVLTAREPPGLRDSLEHALTRLSPVLSRSLLADLLRTRGVVQPSAGPHVDRLLAMAGGLPLILDLIAERARSVPLTTIATELERDIDALGTLPGDWRPARHRDLRAWVEDALASLHPDLRRAGRRISLLAGPIPMDLARKLLAETRAGPRGIARLAAAGIVELPNERGDLVVGHSFRLALKAEASDDDVGDVARALHTWWTERSGTLTESLAELVFAWLSDVATLALSTAASDTAARLGCDALQISYQVGLPLDCTPLVASLRARLRDAPNRARIEFSWAKLQTRALPRAEGLVLLAKATDGLRGLVPDPERCDALLFLAHNQLYADWIEDALHSFELAKGLATDPTTRTRVQSGLAGAQRDSGDPRAALRTAEQAVALGMQQQDLVARAGALHVLALSANDIGLRQEAAHHAGTAVRTVEHLVGTRILLNSLFILGNMLRCADRLDEALAVMDRSLALASTMRDARLDSLVAMNRALLLLDMDRPEQAQQTLLGHLTQAVTVGARLPVELRVIGELARARSGQEPIGLDLRAARETVLAHAAVPDRIIFQSWCTEIAIAAGDVDLARESLRAAQDRFRDAGYGADSEVGRAIRLAEAAVPPDERLPVRRR